MTFSECVAHARAFYDEAENVAALHRVIKALEALAAERAEAKRVEGPASFAEFCVGQETAQPPREATPYERAMTAPRMGGQHPHDGRHIMSMRHWGMVG